MEQVLRTVVHVGNYEGDLLPCLPHPPPTHLLFLGVHGAFIIFCLSVFFLQLHWDVSDIQHYISLRYTEWWDDESTRIYCEMATIVAGIHWLLIKRPDSLAMTKSWFKMSTLPLCSLPSDHIICQGQIAEKPWSLGWEDAVLGDLILSVRKCWCFLTKKSMVWILGGRHI